MPPTQCEYGYPWAPLDIRYVPGQRSFLAMPLPRLPTPSKKPRQRFQVVLLTWVLHRLEDRRVIALPRRDVQLALSRIGGSSVSGHLAGLVADGWLQSSQGAGSETYRYSLGPRLTRSPKLQHDWLELSMALWGPDGLLALTDDPAALGHRMFRVEGMLVLGVVVRSGSPVSVAEVHSTLGFFMSRQTVSRRLKSLAADKLIEDPGGLFVARSEWRRHLDEILADEKGGGQRHDQLVEDTMAERQAYAMVIAHGHLTRQDRLQILENPCIDCGGPAKEIEHFPPKKHGGFDNVHVVFPICRRCNNDLSPFIRWLPKAPLPLGHSFEAADRVDPVDLLRASVLHNRAQLINAFHMWTRATTRRERRKARLLAVQSIQFARALLDHLRRTGDLSRSRLPGTMRFDDQSAGRIPY